MELTFECYQTEASLYSNSLQRVVQVEHFKINRHDYELVFVDEVDCSLFELAPQVKPGQSIRGHGQRLPSNYKSSILRIGVDAEERREQLIASDINFIMLKHVN